MTGERMKLAKKLFKEPTKEVKPTNPPLVGFKPRSVKITSEECGVPVRTLENWYRDFRANHDDVSWRKQSEANYDAFCEWLISLKQKLEEALPWQGCL